MDEKKQYHDIITNIWKLLKTHIDTVDDIKSADDPRWAKICVDFDRIYDNAPPNMKDYADSMVKMHIYELERRWRH